MIRDLRIKKIELFKVPPRWLFLKMTTEGGLVGWGEPVVEGKADSVAAAVKEYGEQLIGHDASHIEDAVQMMYRGGFYRGGPVLSSAMSGIEQAMWDIKGKYLGVPVYDLLGGKVRDRIQVYRWIGGDRPHDVVAQAEIAVSQGYKAVKMNGTDEMKWVDSYDKLDDCVERVAAIREKFPKLGIAVDFHGRVHKTMAKVLMHKLEPYDLMFVEEPVLCENEEEFTRLRLAANIPLATGERNFTRWGFKNMLMGGGVDIIQPDVSHCGGIWELRKIAAMAEAYDVSLAPHCPLGPIALAACLAVDFCTPNAFIQEQSAGIHYNEGYDLLNYIKNRKIYEYKDGNCEIFSAPGLGVEIDEDYVRRMAEGGHRWHNPIWRDREGAVAEW